MQLNSGLSLNRWLESADVKIGQHVRNSFRILTHGKLALTFGPQMTVHSFTESRS